MTSKHVVVLETVGPVDVFVEVSGYIMSVLINVNILHESNKYLTY